VTPTRGQGAQPPGPDSAELLRAAARADFEISDRMLETFRAQGLIPRPHRAGYRGRAPVWRYPPGTDRQLAALLGWRQHTKDADLLKVLLWLDGFGIPATAVRDALTRQLRKMTQAIEQAISDQAEQLGLHPADDSARRQAVDALARTMAAKRGASPVPRRNRVRAGDRAHAVALLIRSFGLGETVDGTPAEGAAIERVLGISPNGRRRSIADTGPWLTGPAEDLFGAASITGLPHLLDAVAGASEADLAAARQTVVALFRHLPVMARMIGVMFGDDNYTGLAGAGQIDQHPETVVYIVPTVIAMLKAGWNENLDAVTSALQPVPELVAQAQRILDMPAATIEANLAGQPADVRERAQRLIDAAIEGKFDPEVSSSS
jgi:hypothetical protein